ncbi:NADase-type glycan-binding domain-containing protein [Treponema zioleckii]|uniref:NADase-type glycan-binding domain-containing protein n=1 Tax=Treponema zioleckii TaxID=331680 RepID=UPI001F5B7EC6|nr:nicotine adenine dinucleotide glycohydrolase [Treponema zioleckii]
MKNCFLLILSILIFSEFVSCKEEKKVDSPLVSETKKPDSTSVSEEKWFMAQTNEAAVTSVVATSELVEAQFEGRYLYPPINILDGDFENTWCEADKDGPGIGESVTVEFAEPVSFDEIQIVNGFVSEKWPNLYKDNNRIKGLLLTQVAREHFQQKEYTLADDVPDWQSIKFELPQTAQTLTFKITDVYKGNKYDDTCLDDVRLLWKGKVIPFSNVYNLKNVQNENSKLMLEKSASDFKKEFESLFDGGSELYLLADNPARSLIISRRDYTGSVDITQIETVEIVRSPSKEEFLEKIKDYEPAKSPDTYNPEKAEYCAFGPVEYEWGDTEYELGSFRINKTVQVGYVETKTAFIAKIDGSDVFINGVHYRVLNRYKVADWRSRN